MDLVAGLSFGGLIAQQIAELLDLKNVILISSFKSKNNLRFIFSYGMKLRLFKLLPTSLSVNIMSETIANFLNSSTKESKPALKEMIKKTDLRLMKWSIQKIFEQNNELASGIIKYNIIGTKDRIVKLWKNDSTFIIEGGSHFMVYDHANEVSSALQKIILRLN